MILLSFDTEEFDVPREHGVDFTLEQGMAVSKVGTNRILDVLKEQGVKATFFCTGNFAENAPEVMQRIMDDLKKVKNVVVFDIDKLAKDNGVPRSANVILLGAAQRALGIEYEKLENAIRRVFARKGDAVVEANIKALAIGKEAQS